MSAITDTPNLLQLWQQASDDDKATLARLIAEHMSTSSPSPSREEPKEAKAKKPRAKKDAASSSPAAESAAPTEAPAFPAPLQLEDPDGSRCHGRGKPRNVMDRLHGFKPFLWKEVRCSGSRSDGSTLCTDCTSRKSKFEAGENPSKSHWHGIVGGPFLDESHIAGSAWSLTKCKWVGNSVPSSGASSTSSKKSKAPKAPVDDDGEIADVKPKKRGRPSKKAAAAAAADAIEDAATAAPADDAVIAVPIASEIEEVEFEMDSAHRFWIRIADKRCFAINQEDGGWDLDNYMGKLQEDGETDPFYPEFDDSEGEESDNDEE